MKQESTHLDAVKAMENQVSSAPPTPSDDTKPSSPDSPDNKGVEEEHYPDAKALALIMLSLYLAFFLVALDHTIIATAIPQITDTFHSLDDIGWYGSAYMLTACAFQLLFGRIYTFYSPKWVFLAVVGIFELGSAICGAAPNSTAFIVGRAIQGLGSAGTMSGAIVIIMHSVPLHKRPMWTGFIGAIFGIASVAGPLLGGVFTTKVSWRWCFYINLPIGGLSFVLITLTLKLPNPKEKETWRQQLAQLDPIGTFFFLPGIICLLLALQWGGSTYAWSNGRIIALLVLFAVLISAFIAVQLWKKDTATVPPHIIKQRSVAAGVWYATCSGASMMLVVYYLPIWFQAIKGVSAVRSGIDTISLVMGLVVSSIIAGGLVTRTGYFTPFMILSSVIQSIGAGLLTTLTTHTGHSEWIGFQVLYGMGIGFGMQQPSMAAQTVLTKKDVPTGVSLMMFGRQLGGALFISVGGNVFTSYLISGLSHIPNVDAHGVVNTGATELRHAVDPHNLGKVLEAYNGALVNVFQVAIAVSCATIIGALATEWRSVKKARLQGGGAPPGGNGAEGASKGEKQGDGNV